MIAFRALQGLGGALLAPAALSLLITTFAEGRDRNRALGIYGAASGSGAAAGVLLGGVLTSYLSWSWIFFVNVPVGIVAAALAPLLLRESRADLGHRHFDLARRRDGHGGADAARLCAHACDERRLDVDRHARALTGGGRAGRVRRGRVEVDVAAPAAADLPAADALGANVAMAIVGAVAFSEFFLLTLYLQDVLHYSAVAERRRLRRLRRHGRRRLEPRAARRRPDRRARHADRRSA